MMPPLYCGAYPDQCNADAGIWGWITLGLLGIGIIALIIGMWWTS